MFMHKSKKGFTIVELVIVIAVIAILAAVLIPTFSNLVKKANQSADIQAARQMNTVLAAEGAVKAPDIFGLFDALAANGMTAKDYKPLATDHYFFWDDDANRIVYTDKNYQVLFPADYTKSAKANWLSLTQKIAATKPAGYSATTPEVAVKTAEELVYVLEEVNNGARNVQTTITIPAAGVDMKGAAFSVTTVDENITITGGPIKNATAVDISFLGAGTDEHNKGQYGCSLFGNVESGKTLTIENVVFENLNIKNTNASGTAILVGQNSGTVKINNVTIKNSTVIGHRNIGALVGNNAGKVQLSGDIKLENVSVLTVGGRSGMLIGIMEKYTNGNTAKFEDTSTITMTNCTFGIYECEQNTGANYGLKSDGRLYSWALDANMTKADKDYQHYEDALVLTSTAFDKDIAATPNNSIFNNVVVK